MSEQDDWTPDDPSAAEVGAADTALLREALGLEMPQDMGEDEAHPALARFEERVMRAIHRADLGGEFIRFTTVGFADVFKALVMPLVSRAANEDKSAATGTQSAD